MALPSDSEDVPNLDEMKIQAFNNVTFQTLQRLEPIMFRKREENGVSSPHVLSMRPYAHIQAKHVKKGL